MAQSKSAKPKKTAAKKTKSTNPFELQKNGKPSSKDESRVHSLGPGIICDTEARGHASPQGRSPLEIVVDASEGFVPLWAKGSILRWRFRERSMNAFANPTAAKREIRKLFGEALMDWGSAAPVRFKEDDDMWDFEIVMRQSDDCDSTGCVLASAFFPDAGRHEFVMYPKLFTQGRNEQVETFIHEIGHIFGLRHFFAKISEKAWPAEIFGTHSKFSIMNYGNLSHLTDDDRNDLRDLYNSVWSGELTNINGTPVQLVKPYSSSGITLDSMLGVGLAAKTQ